MQVTGKAKIVGIVAGAVLLVTLTGCENSYRHGPYELGFDGRNLQVVSCVNRDVETVSVSEFFLVDGARKSRDVWKAEGSRRLSVGDLLIVGGENSGLENTLVESSLLEAGHEYYVEFNQDKVNLSSAWFVVPETGLPKGKWLTSTGDVRDTVCKDVAPK
ncbi:hypothetical protein GCM10009651_28370 [Microbacterium natoriense]|uniref:hypothetical protein n=1 Tax=Microbacterium TaxID=33882 RepID=UPI0011B0C935|nr:hypothetical protein [Microbacterium sp. MYb72]